MKRIAQKLKRFLFERDMSLWSFLYICMAVGIAKAMEDTGHGLIAQAITAASILTLGIYVEKVAA